ncbi:DUF4279 domain-containing protein [Paenibacillus sp. FSL W7-1287]|uniref:DUF4279 domain-containing protein n=1 Tax=Paenibacillus sp. FSL W7-1287 TaxID=2954538 RepID=UPI0030FC0492
MLEKTNARVYLRIYGDSFPIDLLTELLKIQPTQAYSKGEEIIRKPNPNVIYRGKHYRQESAWELSTEYEETYDLEKPIDEILIRLKNKEEIIKDFCKEYDLKCHFMIVIVIKNGETPSIVLNKELISIANYIEAEIHFDLYAHPYESEFDS